ncbi:uncharacterized protein isoform X5 [Salmo salar]|uniref:Uncharacterized protein isoform X5 n=1 Tax=Salmo salar TaxID=8030 RepID=A0ABM3CKS8_SALSA|nr:uncharacterized protein LOC106595778 isoform X5 [Salmo salar]
MSDVPYFLFFISRCQTETDCSTQPAVVMVMSLLRSFLLFYFSFNKLTTAAAVYSFAHSSATLAPEATSILNPKMTSATSFLFFAIHLACIRAGNSFETFVKLECKEEYHGVYGQQSLLECIVKAVQNVTILTVTWKRVGGDALLLEYHKHVNTSTLGFKFAEPSWNKKNMNVSLLLTNTKMADKGEYECMVRTDSGDATATISLSVTAMYKSPTMSSSPENCIKQNTGVTIFCNSTGSKDDFASDSTTQWLAPVGVIGSLVIGLLAALLIFKRRSVQRARRLSTFPLMSHSGHPTDTHHADEAEGKAILTV